MEIINIDNQEVEYYKEKGILKLTIGSPFHSANKQYSWPVDSKGIGINQKIVKLASDNGLTILIKLEDSYYSVEGWVLENFCEKTKSYYIKKLNIGQIILYVYPLDYMYQELNLSSEKSRTNT